MEECAEVMQKLILCMHTGPPHLHFTELDLRLQEDCDKDCFPDPFAISKIHLPLTIRLQIQLGRPKNQDVLGYP